MTRALALILAIASSAAIATAQAPAGSSRQVRLTPNEIAAMPSTTPGAGTSGIGSIQMTVLYGSPDRSGIYTIALSVPPNTQIAAHTHRDGRTAVVVRGSWTFGYGRRADASAVRTLGPGSFYSEPAGLAHFARTGPEGALVYITGNGPSDTHYVE